MTGVGGGGRGRWSEKILYYCASCEFDDLELPWDNLGQRSSVLFDVLENRLEQQRLFRESLGYFLKALCEILHIPQIKKNSGLSPHIPIPQI